MSIHSSTVGEVIERKDILDEEQVCSFGRLLLGTISSMTAIARELFSRESGTSGALATQESLLRTY